MRGPGQAENPQYGCKVDNKYDVIADSDDPFETLERLEKGVVAKKEPGTEKSKPKSAGDKQAGTGSSSVKKAETKKEAAVVNKPQSATSVKQQDASSKKQAGERVGPQERPKTAGDKSARGDGAQLDQRRARGGAAIRGSAMPQQAGVVGLTTATGSAEISRTPQQSVAGDEEHAVGNTDGFQPQRLSAGGYRGRRGGPRGGAYYGGPPSSGGAPRRPYRGGFGGARHPPAQPNVTSGEQEASDPQQAVASGAAQNEGGEPEEQLDRNFERHRPYGYGGFRGGQPGYGRRGGFRRGGPGGYFEDGSGRKREFERHSGSDVTGVRAVDKKNGAGQHNWGGMRDDLAGQTETQPEGEQVEDSEKRATGEAGAATNVKEAKAGEAWTDLVHADESAKAAEGTNAEGTQQDKMYVLDDWKAKEEKQRFRVPEFNVRKPNEGVDESSKWSGFVLKKREEEAAPAGEEEDAAEEDEAHQGADGDDVKRRAKQRLNIPVKFADSMHRGRGGYGTGRGGPRGAGAPPPPFEHREGGEQREGGTYRGGYDRPRSDRGSGYRGTHRGSGSYRADRAGGAQSGAPQLTMDEFPSLNKQAA